MKFKELKPIIKNEWITIFETFPAFNVLRERHKQLLDPEKPTEWDNNDVALVSGIGDCELYVYLYSEDKEPK